MAKWEGEPFWNLRPEDFGISLDPGDWYMKFRPGSALAGDPEARDWLLQVEALVKERIGTIYVTLDDSGQWKFMDG